MLRRAAVPPVYTPLEVWDLRIDTQGFRVMRAGVELVLSATEFKLLAVLAEHAGTVLTRDRLVEQVWEHSYLNDSRLVDMAVLRLRERLGEAPSGGPYISTIRGVGYRFERD